LCWQIRERGGALMRGVQGANETGTGRHAAPSPVLFFVLDWFHDEQFAEHLSARHWRRLPPRVEQAVDRAIKLCAAAGAKATFFVPGSIALTSRRLVSQICQAGHDLGLLGAEPGDLGAVPVEQQAAAWEGVLRARATLEHIAGIRIQAFAAPWPVRGPLWWRDRLAAAGFACDASVLVGRVAASEPESVVIPTWWLDVDQPRLVGLPRTVLRKHYDCLMEELPPQARGAVSLRQALGLAAPEALPSALLAEQVQTSDDKIAPGPLPRAGLPRLALVIPMKDERAGLPSLLRELMAVRTRFAERVDWQWIFVDDGSSDDGFAWLQREFGQQPAVRLLRHERNRGIAAALQTGFAASDAEWLASIDADLSYDPLELLAMLPQLADADVVTASPYHPQGGVKNVPGWRLLLSRVLSLIYRILLRSDISTWTSCCRVYRGSAVRDLPVQHPGFLGTAELLVRVLRRGGVVREHPCVLEARLFGVSKLRVLRTIGGHLRLLWQVARGRIR